MCQGESLDPYNFLKSSKCSTFSKLQTQRLLNIAIGEITMKRKAERKIEEMTREVSNHDNWPSFALFRFLHADTASPHSNVFGSMLSGSSEWRLEEGRGSPPCELCSFPSPFTRSYIPRLQGWKWETLEISGREYLPPACQVERDKIRQI